MKIFQDRFDGIEFALNSSQLEGQYLEFGVFQGKSIKLISDLVTPKKVYGFDSFIGLPEDWDRGDTVYRKGHFSLESLPTGLPSNVVLVEGFFEDSIKKWKETHNKVISFLHIDVDLYSSTKTILTELDSLIKPGTIICFDEYCDWTDSGIYKAWREGEYKAFQEWGRKAELIAKHGLFGAVFKIT